MYASIPRLPGRASVLNRVAELAASIPMNTSFFDVRVLAAPARRSYQGKQARRAAFYERQRTARRFNRVLDAAADGAQLTGCTDAMRDALVHGMGMVRIMDTWDHASPDGDKAVLTRALHRKDGTIEVLEQRVVDPSPVFHFEHVRFEDFADRFEKR